MTPEEFAVQTGLSLEEAEMVLRARRSKSHEAGAQARVLSKLERAFEALGLVERKVGVKPYEESK